MILEMRAGYALADALMTKIHPQRNYYQANRLSNKFLPTEDAHALESQYPLQNLAGDK